MLPTISGSANMTLGAAKIAPAAPPHTYLGVAKAIAPAVAVLARSHAAGALPLCLLAAHQAECLLKAYLSRDGVDTRLRKKEVRHNLRALWSMAHSEGLNATATPPSWLERLADLHAEPYYLRYSTGVHGIVTPAPGDMASGLDELSRIVEEGLAASQSCT